MIKWISVLFAAFIINGCSTPPSNPAPHENKYTVQILELKVSVKPPHYTFRNIDHETQLGTSILFSLGHTVDKIEDTLSDPETHIIEYPVIRTGLNTPCSLNETKPVSLTENFILKNGKIKLIKKNYPLGTTIDLNLIETKADHITYQIDLKIKRLKGSQPMTIAEQTVHMPVFSEKQLDTEIQQSFGKWVSLGTLDKFKDPDNQRFSIQYAVRILPPKTP
ncbi:hypothetical protein [Pontiella agarivorans]|uniref:Uncharacterized protein n=1 Tax=Pontiella agarivorans TaxID=3038953 RepID=A0ABU5N1A2_9BACT|nr:hypothetical protein [Pontiella agarivorans]MDZ8120210.1 hypothetical protein [Pontiella agarivorans]